MFPYFNSLPLHSNGNPSSVPQQGMGNPGNFAPNPMQIPPQLGILNPQTLIPFSNPSSQFVPNQFFPLQGPQNLNFPPAMNQMNNMNNPQAMPQNSIGPSKFFNQNLNLGFPNQIQDINQLFQLQMRNFNPQGVPGNLNLAQTVAFLANSQPTNLNIPQNVAFGGNTQPPNLGLRQNVAFGGNAHLESVDSSGIVQNSGNSNASAGKPNATQQLKGSLSLVQGIGPIPPLQNQKNFHPRPSKFQGNQRNARGNNVMKNNGKPAHHKNFKLNPKHEASGNRIVKPQFQKMRNSKGNFNAPNMRIGRGNDNCGAKQISVANSAIQAQAEEKRSVTLNYTEKEIQQWIAERRKNYPTKVNIEKKLTEKLTKPEVSDKVAQLRRQQLREILAKQAELGCEVAEIPSYYLLGSEQQVNEREESGKAFSKKEKFQNKFNKRGRFNKNDRFNKGFANNNSSDAYCQNDPVAKKKRLANDDSVTHSPMSKREPTLLQKLMNADIKRDKHHLLQAFRFMLMNSFFKDWPKAPLKFPVVIVKETEDENNLVEEIPADRNNGRFLEEIDNDDGCNSGKGVQGGLVIVNPVNEMGNLGEEPQGEEGEIVD